jgi:hypothetical protein
MPELVPRQRKAVLARLALQAAIRNEADLIAMLPPKPPAASAKCANRISIFLRSCPLASNHPSVLRPLPVHTRWGLCFLRMTVVGTNAKCRPRRAMSEFGGKAEDIYSG